MSNNNNTCDVFITKKNEKLLISYNNLEDFKNTYIAYNLSFEKEKTQQDWIDYFPKVLESLEKRDLNYYFHAIKDEQNNVISFILGNFYEDRPGELYVDYLGTVPEYKGQRLAWRLMLSLFDYYPHLHTIEVDTLESADGFYRKHGLTKIGEKDALHPIISPEPIHLAIYQLYRRDVTNELKKIEETRKKASC
ncbi:MAG: GNAT family N-acetyltransferase [bacterium]